MPIAGKMPGMAVVHHIGRRSGKEYRTPVLLFRDDGGSYVIELTYGAESDWVKNVVSAGQCHLTTRGTTIHCTDPHIAAATGHPWAPAIARVILKLVRVDKVLLLTCTWAQ